MDVLLSAFKALIDAGSYVMLPIIITIIGLIFRLPLSKAFKSGITITCGFVGINLLVNLLKSAVSPAASAMVTNFGLNLDVTDVGWGAISSITWASPIVAFLVFEILGINILMLKATKTMDVDIWNYHHMMIAGILVFYVTENIVWALIATAMTAIMTLKFADWTAPLIEHFFGIPDVTLPTISYTSSIIVAAPLNWVIDRIPGLNKLNFSIKSVQKYLGVFGDPMMLGLILGIAMGTSEAAGFVDAEGRITGWLNELAFVPVDANPAAMRDEWSGDVGCGVKYFSQDSVIKLAPRAGIELDEALSPAEKLKVVQARMAEDDSAAADIYSSIGTYLGHTLAYYYDLYACKHVLLLGRVMSGKGGDIVLAEAKRVLREEYPELDGKILPTLPDEKFRRVGQSAAAASLPELKK